MWVHEGFATYAEGLYTECQLGQGGRCASTSSALRKASGTTGRSSAPYGVNREGSGDMYYKGAQHAAHDPPDRRRRRQVARDPARPQQDVLAPDGHRARRSRTTSAARRGSICSQVFDQYLHDDPGARARVQVERGTLSYRWTDVVPGFAMPVRVQIPGSARGCSDRRTHGRSWWCRRRTVPP